ncbi:Amino-acid acetyltransferase [Arsenophonus endosymbiont of Bemisia tabaci Q2]|nr:Amino-acid acetyltransferase [Arsenophonus endosymbiont of Bemisia tabaci Q2]
MEKQPKNHSDILHFLYSAIKACKQGVRRSHLISYQKNGPLLRELFSHEGIGSQITMENCEQIRRANINDIAGIL